MLAGVAMVKKRSMHPSWVADVALLYPPYSYFVREMWKSADKLRPFMHPTCLIPWPQTVVKKAMKTTKNKKVKTMKRKGKVIKAMKTIKSKKVKAMKAMQKKKVMKNQKANIYLHMYIYVYEIQQYIYIYINVYAHNKNQVHDTVPTTIYMYRYLYCNYVLTQYHTYWLGSHALARFPCTPLHGPGHGPDVLTCLLTHMYLHTYLCTYTYSHNYLLTQSTYLLKI